MTTQVMTVDEIRKSRQPAERTSVGLCDSDAFALAQRAGQLLASSGLVPKEYQGNLANCVVALNMAVRIGADPLMVMQNLVIVHGRPTWSSQFLIATFNACGRFSAIRYEFKGTEGQDDWSCRAYAIEKSNGERIEGSWISIALAKTEGWYGKNGSKWKTMPQQMLMYRAASWLVRAYAPELAMGLHTAEEVVDAEASRDVTPQAEAATQISEAAEQAAKNVRRRAPKAEVIEKNSVQPVPETVEIHDPAPEQPSLMVRMQRAQTQDELDIIASEIGMAEPEIRADLNKVYVQESERLNQLPL